MVVAVLIVTGFLALLFYVMYLVKPKRVRLTAKVFKIVEFNVEADSASGGSAQRPGGIAPQEGNPRALPGNGVKALPEVEQKALP